MNYTLDRSDHLIFNELSIDPFQNYNSISKRVNLAPATVKDRIVHMKQNGFLRKDRKIIDPIFGERLQTEVLASYYPPNLELVRLNIIFENIPDARNLGKLIKFCNSHPYTHYRALSFKNSVNLFSQFDVPIDIINEIKTVLESVRSTLNIEKLIIYEAQNYFYSSPNFTKWSLFQRNWEIGEIPLGSNDFIIDTLWSDFIDQKDLYSNLDHEFLYNISQRKISLSSLDAKLLRELTINAKVSLNFLSETYKRTKSVISRHITKLKENIIYKGTLLYDENFFGLNNLQVIFGKFDNHSSLNSETLVHFLKNSSLPFSSNLYYNSEYFVLETTGPSTLSTETAKFIWQHTDPTYFNVNQLHIPSTLVYYFYYENYSNDRNWKIGKEYISDIPLGSIET